MIIGGPAFHIDYNNLVIQVYVVGYRVQGESIIILFKEGDIVFYSIVIDSFFIEEETARINRTIDILDSNGVDKVSMLFMTHPHKDHILGMDELVNTYIDGRAKFYYPTHAFDIEKGNVVLTEEEKMVLDILRQNKDFHNSTSNQVGVPEGGYVTLETIKIFDNDDSEEKRPIPIEIVALTPVVSVNDWKRSNKRLDPNDLSISLLINIQDYYLFFGADTTNAHISHFDNDTMSAVRFVKIPHHASDTSDKLVDYLATEQLDYACSTSFYVGQSSLPKDEVIELYLKASKRVDIIGCSSDDARPGVYGDICYTFRPGRREMLSSVMTEGLTNQAK